MSGIIYLHRISDFRMGGTSRKNLNVFREICGEEALKNVTVATTMWNEVDMDVGISRELELMSEEDFFRSVLEHGTKMRRHDGSKQSAWDIIEEVLQNCPRTLLIQDELVIQKKDITETSAAREVGRQQAERKRREEKELLDLEEQLLQAKAISDTQTIEELEQLKADLEASVVQMEASRADLPRRSNNEQRRMHQELSNLLELSNAEIVRTSIEENRESEGVSSLVRTRLISTDFKTLARHSIGRCRLADVGGRIAYLRRRAQSQLMLLQIRIPPPTRIVPAMFDRNTIYLPPTT